MKCKKCGDEITKDDEEAYMGLGYPQICLYCAEKELK